MKICCFRFCTLLLPLLGPLSLLRTITAVMACAGLRWFVRLGIQIHHQSFWQPILLVLATFCFLLDRIGQQLDHSLLTDVALPRSTLLRKFLSGLKRVVERTDTYGRFCLCGHEGLQPEERGSDAPSGLPHFLVEAGKRETDLLVQLPPPVRRQHHQVGRSHRILCGQQDASMVESLRKLGIGRSPKREMPLKDVVFQR